MQPNPSPIDVWVVTPIQKFISNQTTSGMVLFGTAMIALIWANSPWSEAYHATWAHELSIGYDQFIIKKDLHHWINDGLMAVFFFVIGLELKREIIAGELSTFRDALLPLGAGIGGMVVPALFYYIINPTGPESAGWGIPMATDIAFALGILYLLGNKVPLALKVFLTALAIADDIGAVMVIAFFYTSEISFQSLGIGAIFMVVLVGANILGVKNTTFYGIVGIGGLWLAFLLSGVHATIAAVLAALTIPAQTSINKDYFLGQARLLTDKFDLAKDNNTVLVTKEQFHLLERFRHLSKNALTPLQRLEHSLHPFVAFLVMPVFALANAGVTFSGDFIEEIQSPVTLGIIVGLIAGKVVGIVLFSKLMVKMKWASLPANVNWMHVYGAAFLAAVGFTMSLFITELAFTDPKLILQAKMAILIASFIAGLVGFFILKTAGKKQVYPPEAPPEL